MSVQLEVKERAIRPRSLRNQLRHEGKYLPLFTVTKLKVHQSILKKRLIKILREHGANTVIKMTVDGKTSTH